MPGTDVSDAVPGGGQVTALVRGPGLATTPPPSPSHSEITGTILLRRSRHRHSHSSPRQFGANTACSPFPFARVPCIPGEVAMRCGGGRKEGGGGGGGSEGE
eukprot:3811702-Rhodomonas_salina.1